MSSISIFILFISVISTGASAATITVTSTADSGAGSLRDAIGGAANGDTINFNLTYPTTIALTTGELVIDKNLTIAGPGASSLTISGNGASRIFRVRVDANVYMHDIAIANGRPLLPLGTPPSPDDGGGIHNYGTLTVTNCMISDNSAWDGGGIWNGGSMTVRNSTISRNRTYGDGGGINNMGSLTVIDSTISANNTRYNGGGIYNSWSLTILNSKIVDNGAAEGGGIANRGYWHYADAVMIAAGSTISGNSATGGGGGIDGYGPMTVADCTISGNSALGGGGIASSGILMLTNGTISGNTARSTGGAISSGGSLIVTNSTISGNTAGYRGGAISSAAKIMTIKNSTVSNNGAGNKGGGIYNVSGNGTMANSIIADNEPGANCSGVVGDGGNNIDDGISCGFGPTSQSNTNPLLDPAGLKENGGPTQTIALLTGSPAINAASECPNTDQRGVVRPRGAGCDIGAYEYIFLTESATRIMSSENPSVFGRDVILTATVIVSQTANIPTGSVTFRDGSTILGTSALSGETASYSTSALTLGSHTITAEYSGDSSTGASISAPVTQLVNKIPTTTLITGHLPQPSVGGQPVTVSFEVATVPLGGGSPTGSVTISDGVNGSCTATVAAGSCTIYLPMPVDVISPEDWVTLTATYSGDAIFAGSYGQTYHVILYQGQLTVGKVGNGSVQSDTPGIEGAGINCGQDCTATYIQGTVVKLSATPAAGWLFGGWSGSCNGAPSCSVTMNGNKSVTATFIEDIYMPITGIRAMAYEPVAEAIAYQLFEETYPIGLGPYAISRDRISVNTSMKAFAEPADLYFVVRLPGIEPDGYYQLKQDNTFKRVSEGPAPWKTNWTGAIDENLFGFISAQTLPAGTYELYMMATPTGRTDEYRLWETAFNIPYRQTMPLPSKGSLYKKQPSAFPARSIDPSTANPIGLGSAAVDGKAIGLSTFASMGGSIELKLGLEGFDGPADLYFGIYMPDTEPNEIFVLGKDGVFQGASKGLSAWKTGHSGPVDEVIVAPVPVTSIPKGRYIFYLLATPQGRLDNWYLWETETTIP